MSRRLLCSMALVFAAVICLRAEDSPSSPKLVVRTYLVADLVTVLNNLPSSAVELFGRKAPQNFHPQDAIYARELMDYITGHLSPESWANFGGQGTVDYFPMGMTFVVNQTPEVHKEIAALLQALRQMDNQKIVVEAHICTLPESDLDDLRLAPFQHDNTTASVPIIAALDASKKDAFLEVVRARHESRGLGSLTTETRLGKPANLHLQATRFDTVRFTLSPTLSEASDRVALQVHRGAPAGSKPAVLSVVPGRSYLLGGWPVDQRLSDTEKTDGLIISPPPRPRGRIADTRSDRKARYILLTPRLADDPGETGTASMEKLYSAPSPREETPPESNKCGRLPISEKVDVRVLAVPESVLARYDLEKMGEVKVLDEKDSKSLLDMLATNRRATLLHLPPLTLHHHQAEQVWCRRTGVFVTDVRFRAEADRQQATDECSRGIDDIRLQLFTSIDGVGLQVESGLPPMGQSETEYLDTGYVELRLPPIVPLSRQKELLRLQGESLSVPIGKTAIVYAGKRVVERRNGFLPSPASDFAMLRRTQRRHGVDDQINTKEALILITPCSANHSDEVCESAPGTSSTDLGVNEEVEELLELYEREKRSFGGYYFSSTYSRLSTLDLNWRKKSTVEQEKDEVKIEGLSEATVWASSYPWPVYPAGQLWKEWTRIDPDTGKVRPPPREPLNSYFGPY